MVGFFPMFLLGKCVFLRQGLQGLLFTFQWPLNLEVWGVEEKTYSTGTFRRCKPKFLVLISPRERHGYDFNWFFVFLEKCSTWELGGRIPFLTTVIFLNWLGLPAATFELMIFGGYVIVPWRVPGYLLEVCVFTLGLGQFATCRSSDQGAVVAVAVVVVVVALAGRERQTRESKPRQFGAIWQWRLLSSSHLVKWPEIVLNSGLERTRMGFLK